MRSALLRFEMLALDLRHAVDRVMLVAGTLLWTVIVFAHETGGVALPSPAVIEFGVPAAATYFATVADGSLRRDLGYAAGWGWLVAIGFLIAPWIAGHPLLAAASPFGLLVAAGCARFPATAVTVVMVGTCTIGSLQAFVGLGTSLFINLFLVGLWMAVVLRLLVSEHRERYVFWPAVLAVGAYLGLTAIEIVAADSISTGLASFRTSAWFILAFLLIAYAGWSRETYQRIGRAFVVIALLVGAYAVFRWVVGPAGVERDLATQTAAGINVLPDGHLRTVGSFLTGHQLAFWTSVMAPFCAAYAMASEGRWRIIGGLATVLCVFGMIASEARGPLVGLVVGLVVVVALYQFARAFRRMRIATAFIAVATLLTAGAAGAVLVSDDPGLVQRYENILDPGTDPAFEQRLAKWDAALADIDEHPFGQGLGTAGQVQQTGGRFINTASGNIDSSYLKIAYEQGMVVMAFFVVALLFLAGRMAIGALTSTKPEIAGLAIGAVGALLSTMVSFYSGIFIETPVVVAAWLVVGLGLSGLVVLPPEERQEQEEASPPSTAP